MNKGLEKYWLDERKLYRRDLKAGHIQPGDLKVFWDDKVEYRSHEYDPSATFIQYAAFVTEGKKSSKKASAKKAPKKKPAKKTKAKKKRRGWWPFW